MKKLYFLLCMLLLTGGWQSAKADVTNLSAVDGWEKLTAMPSDDWGGYYYVIANKEQELMLQLGKGSKDNDLGQGTTNNTLWMQRPVDPLQDQTVLFTIERTVSSSTSTVYGILRCVAYPDYFLQTESGRPWYYHTHDNGGGDKSWGRLEIKYNASGFFYMKNGKIGSTNYLGAWNTELDPTNYPAGTEVALNKESAKQGHFLIYAIKKTEYAALQQARLDAARKNNPQNVTWFVRDPNFSLSLTNSAWTVGSGSLALGGNADNLCAEFFNCTFDINQTVTGLRNGVYQLKAQGFYRVGDNVNSPAAAATARNAGTEVINASFYANTTSTHFASVFDNKCTTNKGTDWVSSTGYTIGGTTYYVPTNMARASKWFSEGIYDNTIEVVVTDGTLKIGARKTVANSQDWSIFDNFRLYYLGVDLSAEVNAALDELKQYEDALAANPDATFAQIVNDAKTTIENASSSDAITAALNTVKEAYKWYVLKTDVYVSRKAAYTNIAAQQTKGGIAFNTEDADAANSSATSVDAAERALNLLGRAVTRYMNNFAEEFDLTSLIVNPSFETESPLGWSHANGCQDTGSRDNSNNIYTMSNADGSRIFNTYTTSEATDYDHFVLQTIDYMPAGQYQLSAVVAGNQSDAKLRLVANDASTNYIQCTDKAIGVPVTLDFDAKTGSLQLGARSNRWFKADNFQLKYKPLTMPESWDDVDLGTINIENEQVRAFLTEADYRRMGAASVVANYVNGISDKPATVQILWPEQNDDTHLTLTVSETSDFSAGNRVIVLDPATFKYELSNCIPTRTYYYKVEANGVQITNGQFQTEGMVRMIATEGGSNVRDLGGRITLDGRRVKYGRIYRGGELRDGVQTSATDNDLAMLHDMGITGELDLRSTADTNGQTPDGSSIEGANYLFINLVQSEETLCSDEGNRAKVRDAIHFIAEQLKSGNVYFHCIWGADRTGAIAFFVENILNCSTEDMYKDFELTSFSKAGHRAANWADYSGLCLQSKIVYIQEHYEGNTLQEKVVNYLKYCGVTDADITSIREQLLEDDAEAYAARLTDLKSELGDIITKAGATWSPESINTIDALKAAYNTAMNALTTEVDLTAVLSNATFTNGTTDWVVRGVVIHGGADNKCVEIFENNSSVRQTIDNLPAGTYILKAQGYQCHGGQLKDAYNDYKTNGNANLTSYIMLNSSQQTLRNLFEDAQNAQVRNGDGNPVKGMYVPNSLNGASQYFGTSSETLYWNVTRTSLSEVGSVMLGAAQTGTETSDWTAFDNFRLYYRGASYDASALDMNINEAVGVASPTTDSYLNVTSNRTLAVDKWNTLCLPFDMTAEMMEDAHITEARTLSTVTETGEGGIKVGFAEVTELKAGLPYIVKVSEAWTVAAKNVLVRAKQPVSVYVNDNDHNYFMTGNYAPHTLHNEFFISNNLFYYADRDKQMNALRAYITLDGIMDSPNPVRSFTIELDEETGIELPSAVTNHEGSTVVYDLQGRRVNNSNLHGLYIKNNKKFLVK